ncbi:FAD-dependent oxidoreductase [Duganella sp. BJB1802]|uniref:flavin monoamine oxidase family protein n=1 Tax=Duganella sp. BJB1802 TaxID=2744575 RepID=UPI0015937526|nr:FAD-dependent oxidoreductase [Duganella sp. BJB1802]NVD69863.1 FAD-dependent oxidoreductase [Duganella sp. BJB1802]
MVDKNTALNTGMQDGLKLDVAIVGAGISGIYSAYRLTTAGASTGSQVQVFDMNTRIAGRLESVRLPGMPTVQGELGGMRYLTSQKIVTTLIEEVFADQMEAVEFPMGDPADLYMYLRKDRCKQNAWTEAQRKGEKLSTRYYLDDDDIGFSADQLFSKVIYNVLTADPWFRENYGQYVHQIDEYNYAIELTLRQWDQIKPYLTYRFEGSPYDRRLVNDIGFWNLLKDQVSQEGYTFLSTAGGYYSNTINWNAAEAFPYMIGDFSAGATYKTIAQGFDSTVYAMANAYMSYPGACIWSENKLLTFNRQDPQLATHRYELVFLNLRSNQEWRVYANRLVLAMPRRSLELLDQDNFFFNVNQNTELNKNIRSVIMEPAFKILMGFDTPWWNELGITAGHSITDLPMRQCYYFGTAQVTDHSMLLGSYGDMETETFWKALSDDPVKFRPRATRLASQQEVEALNDVAASDMMVKEVVKELRELHGVGVPMPYVTWFKDWGDDPFGAGYHAWKAGYKVQDVMPYMRKPLSTEDIHICGEAYSDQQGWVEGAFCEAEKMLQSYFGLPRPSWLPADYYLGW